MERLENATQERIREEGELSDTGFRDAKQVRRWRERPPLQMGLPHMHAR